MTSLQLRDRDSVWHPFTPHSDGLPVIPIIRGEGTLLFDEDNRPLIDAISSWWVTLHGHAHPVLARALTLQAHRLEQVIFAGFTHEPAVRLSELLLEMLPSSHRKVFFTDNGSTAVEAALKMAIQYYANQGVSRTGIIALKNAYHGDTLGAMSVGERGVFTAPFHDLLLQVEVIDPYASLDHVVDDFTRIIEHNNHAAFIFEPLVQGASGMGMYSPDVLDALLPIAQEHGILCIADEVMTGFGRTGRMYACDYLAHAPDFICMAKGITGGFMTLGAVSTTLDVYEQFQSSDFSRTFLHGHSYTGSPLACAVACANIEILRGEECQERIRRISELQKTLATTLSSVPHAVSPRSCGTIFAVQFGSAQSLYTSSLRNSLYSFFIEKGILMRPLGNVLYTMPPYSCTDQELSTIHSAVEEAFLLFP
jgi:adenosylmethionine---8-amino-7-oxononanoate aminotransferase